jgi:hypothetical protein
MEIFAWMLGFMAGMLMAAFLQKDSSRQVWIITSYRRRTTRKRRIQVDIGRLQNRSNN